MTFLYIALSIVVFVLLTYLSYLLNKISKIKKEQLLTQKKYEESFKKRKRDLFESLYTLSLAITQEQISVAEGCIRVKKLIDLDQDLRFHEDLTYFHKAYLDFSNFSYLEAYQKLTKEEQWQEDLKRKEVEITHESGLRDSAHHLKRISQEFLSKA